MKKSILTLTLTASLTSLLCAGAQSTAKVSAETITFQDAIPDWAQASITQAVAKGYVDGYPDGTFKPDNQVSRAEFMKMLVNDLRIPKRVQKDDEAWYQPYVDALREQGIHNTRDNDNPDTDYNDILTRDEMTKLANRVLDKNLQDPNLLIDAGSAWWNMTRTGVIQGLDKGQLGQMEGTTRAQAVTIIERINAVKNGKSLNVDKAAMSYAEVLKTGTNAVTMWNTELNQLPMEFEGPNGTKVVLDKFLVLDASDPDSAYYDWLEGFQKKSGNPLDDSYVFLFHYNIKIPANDVNEVYPFPVSILAPLGGVIAPINRDAVSDSPLKPLGRSILYKDGDTEFWVNRVFQKSKIDEDIKEAGSVLIYIKNDFTGETKYLSKIEPPNIPFGK